MKFYSSFLFFLIYFHFIANSQNEVGTHTSDLQKMRENILCEYKLDQVLVNGVLYEDDILPNIGNPFLLGDQIIQGTLIYKEKEYKNVELMYDINIQQLILVITQGNIVLKIMPATDFISSFTINNRHFSKYNITGTTKFYQQVYYSDKLKCLYYWSKHKNKITKDTGETYYEYSTSLRSNYLILNGTVCTYKNEHTFVELFPGKDKFKIRKYIKNNHLSVKKSSDEQISKLLDYCYSLL
jgi:hypothetical protein